MMNRNKSKDRSKEEYRTIVKALKIKVLSQEEELKSLKKQVADLESSGTARQITTLRELKEVLHRLSQRLAERGLLFTDLFKLFDKHYCKEVAKDEPDLPPDFKSFLNVVSSESKVSFQEYLTALSKLGILEAPDQSRDYSHLLVAKHVAEQGEQAFWSSVQEGGFLNAEKLVVALKGKFGLLEVAAFEDELTEGDSWVDFALFEYRVRAMCSEQVPQTRQEEQVEQEDSENNFLMLKTVLKDLAEKIKESIKFSTKRAQVKGEREQLKEMLAKKKTPLTKVLRVLLQNLPERRRTGVITLHVFLKCMRAGGLRGLSSDKYTQIFLCIDREEKGYISLKEAFIFLVENRSKDDALEAALLLMLRAAQELEGRADVDILDALEAVDQEWLSSADLLGVLACESDVFFEESLQLMVFWLLEEEVAKGKVKKLPDSLRCSKSFLTKRLRSLVALESDSGLEEQRLHEQRRMSRFTVAMRIVEEESDLLSSVMGQS